MFSRLVFLLDHSDKEKSTLALRTHDAAQVDYEPILKLPAHVARGLCAGMPGLSFRFGDPMPDAPVVPMKALLRWDGNGSDKPWAFVVAGAEDMDPVLISDYVADLLREHAFWINYSSVQKGQFYLACDPSVEKLGNGERNRVLMEFMAAIDIRAARQVLRVKNGGSLTGMYHIENADGEKVDPQPGLCERLEMRSDVLSAEAAAHIRYLEIMLEREKAKTENS
jgi:hypothetical protein